MKKLIIFGISFLSMTVLFAGNKLTPKIRILPVAGIYGLDNRRVVAYFDHDPKAATSVSKYGMGNNNILDYNGGTRTYDGHKGTDFGVAGFEEQNVGVPILAVEDGTVIAKHDGEYDRRSSWHPGRKGNFVLIDHGNNTKSYYNHLRKNSLIVKVGDKVKAGQQIGLLGSSGNSTWPHLHFEWRKNNVSIDPFFGSYNKIESAFINQPKYNERLIVHDVGLYYPKDRKRLPYIAKRSHYALRGMSRNDKLSLWISLQNIPDEPFNQTWILYNPRGRQIKKFIQDIDGSRKWHGMGASIWQHLYHTGFSATAQIGIWKIEIYHNGELAKSVSFNVCDEPIANRAPVAPPKISLISEKRGKTGFVRCQIGYSVKALDPDLDKIRYHYRWYVNGKLVRNVITAVREDALPLERSNNIIILKCRVSTSDGELESEDISKSIYFMR